jgi:hypothetical protein
LEVAKLLCFTSFRGFARRNVGPFSHFKLGGCSTIISVRAEISLNFKLEKEIVAVKANFEFWKGKTDENVEIFWDGRE